MKNDKIKKEGTSKIVKFFGFPGRFNSVIVVLLVTAYAAIIFWSLSAFFPKYNYVVVPEYNHVEFHYDIDPYIRTTNTVTRSDNGALNIRHTSTAYIYGNYDKYLNNIIFQFSALKKDGTMDYISGVDFFSSSSAPTIHTMMSSKAIDGGQYDTLFGKFEYLTSNSEGETEKRYYQFSEKMITLTSRETKSSKFKDVRSVPGKFSFSISILQPASDSDNYSVVNNLTINNKGEQYHLDYQAFGVTESGEIFPVGSVYNYYLNQTSSTNLSFTSRVAKNIGFETIFVKAYYETISGEATELLYKVDVASLIQ